MNRSQHFHRLRVIRIDTIARMRDDWTVFGRQVAMRGAPAPPTARHGTESARSLLAVEVAQVRGILGDFIDQCLPRFARAALLLG